MSLQTTTPAAERRSVAAEAAPLLRLTNVTAGYDRHPAVHHLSLEVQRGDMLAVVGPNGSGKTTLLRLLAGDLEAMEGEVRLPPAGRCRVAYLPQLNRTDRSFPITVQDLVASGLWHETGALGGLGARAAPAGVGRARGGGPCARCARRLIGSLSGGEFQRVRFAQLMLQDARLVLLDEPFAGVDATTLGVLLPLLAAVERAGRHHRRPCCTNSTSSGSGFRRRCCWRGTWSPSADAGRPHRRQLAACRRPVGGSLGGGHLVPAAGNTGIGCRRPRSPAWLTSAGCGRGSSSRSASSPSCDGRWPAASRCRSAARRSASS